jgi:energy-coupling factor transporter ATP-binding protein EcfA2
LETSPSNGESPNTILVEGLRFAYPSFSPDTSAPWVIDSLNLRVHPGEWLAVMGASDVGKTTLCLLLAGLAPHLTDGTMEGRVVVAGRDTREHPPPALADTLGLLFQEPEAQLFNPTVEAEVAWGLENLGLPATEIQARLDEVLTLLHLDQVRNRNPGELSGGQKKRLALASVLAMRPRVLILDEPMGGLDPVGRQEVLSALSDLRRQKHGYPVTIIMAESDPEAVAAFADRLVVLHNGEIVLEGPPRTLFCQIGQLDAQGIAIPQMARVATKLNTRLNTDFDFVSVDEARTSLSPLLGEGPGAEESMAQRAIFLPLWPCQDTNDVSPHGREEASALRVSALEFWYKDESAPALCGLELNVPSGQFVALIGANGSGKTTLVKHFNGLLRPRRGQVFVAGQDAADQSVGELAHKVGFLFQHPEHQIFSATVRQEVAFGPRNLGLSATQVDACVEAALNRFNLVRVAEEPPAILGYGLRRRVTLASLAAMAPPVLILDEPMVGLDAPGRKETTDWLAELHAQGRTIILVTHDMALVAECAERVVVLSQGQVLADGPPAKIFRQADLLARTSLSPPPTVVLAQALSFPDPALTIEAFCDDYVAQVEGPGRPREKRT